MKAAGGGLSLAGQGAGIVGASLAIAHAATLAEGEVLQVVNVGG